MKMHTKLLGSLALSALMAVGFTGCGSDGDSSVPANESSAAESTVSPYQRVAVIEGTWDDVLPIAEKIAQYVVYTNEATELGLPTNWVIAGANTGATPAETYETSDLLPIPVGTNKSRVIEFCNKAYATEAIATGKFHGSALPCEVSVHSDGTNVYVDMLDAEAIFNIFFTDTADTATDEERAAFAVLASAVKSELRTMIKAGLEDDNGVSAATAVTYTESTLAMGPSFTQSDIDNTIAYKNPYIVYKYTGAGSYSLTDAKTLAEDIITVLGTDAATADTNVPGLSANSAWRSGRPEPIAIPNVKVVEACSPKYAKKATALGSEYITALPCEFTVYVDETAAGYDAATGTGPVLAISFLNPNFMFGTMFEGAVANALADGTIDKADVIEYSTLADVVFADLRMIVDHAVQTSGMTLDITE
ncbi:MAG: DUF302 domain-containing protein [Campylobacterota bacterium]|nr:DUF302 domain-containing protein [Campylobacterota bacterium]